MLASLPKDHVAVYEDEVDIHLNPKIGLDWMVRGQQKEVVTPGQNVKRYPAVAMNAAAAELVWVEGTRKCSDLFIALLERLAKVYAHAKVIHRPSPRAYLPCSTGVAGSARPRSSSSTRRRSLASGLAILSQDLLASRLLTRSRIPFSRHRS